MNNYYLQDTNNTNNTNGNYVTTTGTAANNKYIYKYENDILNPQPIPKTFKIINISSVHNGFKVIATKTNGNFIELVFTELDAMLKWVAENIDPTTEQQVFLDNLNSDKNERPEASSADAKMVYGNIIQQLADLISK